MFQIFVTLIFVYIGGQSIYFIDVIFTDGEPTLYLLTLALSVIFDQIKSIGFLYTIYVVIVRRFMHLNINESEYLKPEILELPKQENAIPRLQMYCLKILESSVFEMCSMGLISIYTIYVLVQLTVADLMGVSDSLM